MPNEPSEQNKIDKIEKLFRTPAEELVKVPHAEWGELAMAKICSYRQTVLLGVRSRPHEWAHTWTLARRGEGMCKQ